MMTTDFASGRDSSTIGCIFGRSLPQQAIVHSTVLNLFENKQLMVILGNHKGG